MGSMRLGGWQIAAHLLVGDLLIDALLGELVGVDEVAVHQDLVLALQLAPRPLELLARDLRGGQAGTYEGVGVKAGPIADWWGGCVGGCVHVCGGVRKK